MWILFQTEMTLSIVTGKKPTTPFKPVAGIQAHNEQEAWDNHNLGLYIVWQMPDCRSASVGDVLMSPDGIMHLVKPFGFEVIEDMPGVENKALTF